MGPFVLDILEDCSQFVCAPRAKRWSALGAHTNWLTTPTIATPLGINSTFSINLVHCLLAVTASSRVPLPDPGGPGRSWHCRCSCQVLSLLIEQPTLCLVVITEPKLSHVTYWCHEGTFMRYISWETHSFRLRLEINSSWNKYTVTLPGAESQSRNFEPWSLSRWEFPALYYTTE
jgi:hypothetical protein